MSSNRTRNRLSNYVVGSVIAHAVLAGAGVFVASKQAPLDFSAPQRQVVEMEFTAPERHSEQQQQPQQEQQPAAHPEQRPAARPEQQPQQIERPQPNARVIRDPQPNPTIEPNPSNTGTVDPVQDTQQNPDPNPNPTQTGTGTAGPISGMNLLTAVGATGGAPAFGNGSMAQVANAVGLAMPTGRTAAQRAEARSAAMFGPSRRCTGTPEECARLVASAPITEALESQQRPTPAGTSRYSRQVSTRVIEEFQPVRQIPTIAAIVRRGVVVSPTSTREITAAERAIDDSSMSRSGYSMSSGTVTIPQLPYRMVRAEIEVDQDAQGTILGTRVSTSSRSQEFDRVAERAIREAVSSAERWETSARRRSRWAIEVSEAVADSNLLARGLTGGSDPNLGWRVAPETANGMRIRYRVRMVSMQLVRDEGQGGAARPSATGRSG
jgi:outer membrane biosynthesis protein TonB